VEIELRVTSATTYLVWPMPYREDLAG